MGVAVGCGARCGAFPAVRYGAARSPRCGAARWERRGAERCVPRRAVPAVRSPPGRGARPWQRSGRRGCCACGRRRCRTIWLSPCRKGVAALRLLEHVTVRGVRAGSLGGGEQRAPPARPPPPGRSARAERGKAGARIRSPLSPSLSSAPRPPRHLPPCTLRSWRFPVR